MKFIIFIITQPRFILCGKNLKFELIFSKKQKVMYHKSNLVLFTEHFDAFFLFLLSMRFHIISPVPKTFSGIHPPFFSIRNDLVYIGLIQIPTQIASGINGFSFPDDVMLSPPKIRIIRRIILLQIIQIRCQFSGSFKIKNIDKGMRRSVKRIIGRTHHDWNDAMNHRIKKLFRHVIFAKGIFKRQVKLVLFRRFSVTR